MKNSTPGLDKTQLHLFQTEGYVVVKGAVSLQLLQQLREQFNELMYDDDKYGKVSYTLNDKQYVSSLEKLCKKGNLASLELLGSPAILSIAESICGFDFFMIQEFGVIKMLGDTTPVLWHQDMLHERSGQCFTMGIYLDEANPGDGALRVVPRSHTSNKNICSLRHEAFVEIPMQPGDILIHDMMLAHSSMPLQKNKLRRVLYFEFLSAAHVERENIYTQELVNTRTKLLHVAMRYYQQLHPGEQPFNWKGPVCDTFEPAEDVRQSLLEIYQNEINARPSAYVCFV
jgi:ectoine hydroxylase-related dioxygenase (phytanoyl-CoA dioxygenase family)